MPAVVMRSVCQKTEANPWIAPRFEWLSSHDLAPVTIAAAQAGLTGAHPVQPEPRADALALWVEESGAAMVFASFEMADAVARLLRPVNGEETKVYPAIREKPMARVQAEVTVSADGERSMSWHRPVRRGGCRRAHLPAGADWHQRAVNSGGND